MNKADIKEIKALAADLLIMSYHSGKDLETTAESIESQMDGTQPPSLIIEALYLATMLDTRTKTRRVARLAKFSFK